MRDGKLFKVGIPLAAAAGVLFLAMSCGGGGTQVGGGDVGDIAQARGLSQADVTAALKTYVPTGKMDEYLLFASAGQGGQVLVIGIPSMRLLKVIGVYTPEPWQGWGFGAEATHAVIAEGEMNNMPITWARYPPPGALRDGWGLRRPVAVHQRQGERRASRSSTCATSRPSRSSPIR